MAKTYVVGDIHGGLKALEEVLNIAPIKVGEDTIVFLGDLVDGWSDSLSLIDFLIDFQKKTPCIFIRGNHDYWCQEYLLRDKPPAVWLENSGSLTYEVYRQNPNRKSAHTAFFKAMKNYYIDNENYLYVHAGLESLEGVENDDPEILMNSRKLVMSLSDSSYQGAYDELLKRYNKIFIGHTPTLIFGQSVPLTSANLINLDTGAGLKGPLTIMERDSNTYWQSKPVWQLYPTEKGRLNHSFQTFIENEK